MAPNPTRPLTWLVAFIESLTAVRDPLVPMGMPWVKPAAMLAALNVSSSWSASTVSPWRAANERAVRIESEKLTRKIATAGPTRDSHWDPLRCGRANDGRPDGIDPVTETPWAARSSSRGHHDAEDDHEQGSRPSRQEVTAARAARSG